MISDSAPLAGGAGKLASALVIVAVVGASNVPDLFASDAVPRPAVVALVR